MGHESHLMLLTVSNAVAAGVLLLVLARRLNLPAIVLLLGGGVLLGPELLGWVRPDELGEGLRVVVTLFIGLILFEGGLTLDLGGYRSAPSMIKRLLTAGVLITWLVTAAALRLILGIPIAQAVIAASLVIVTGPTVIAPLLKRIKIHPRLHSILHWEGVLIDPIGVFIALLCFEWVIGAESEEQALLNLLIRCGGGLIIGGVGGLLISFVVRRKLVPEDMVNVFALGAAVLLFGLAELLQSEAGLLSVTVAGFLFGLTGPARIREVRRFKAEITDLLIGTLFILLSARLEFEQFVDFGLRGAAVVAIVMLAVRPLSIIACSFGQQMNWREKTFLSWVAPRGIVAASMASLFTIEIERAGTFPDAKIVETFVYSVIVATIVLQGLSAGYVSRLLGLARPVPTGWMIVGAHALARRVAMFASRTADVPVVLVDSNARVVRDAMRSGFTALVTDARDVTLQERVEMQGVGNILALTDNDDLNVRVCQNWAPIVGADHVFRCDPSGTGSTPDDEETPGRVVWPRLPKPSLLAAELTRLEATTREGQSNDEALRKFATPIITAVGDHMRFDVPEVPADVELPEGPTLFLRRSVDYLRRSIRREFIGPVTATDLRSVFEELVDRIVRVHPRVPRDEVVLDLLERESAAPTALGHGIAVPHAYVEALDGRVCAVAPLSVDGIFDAPDDEPVKLVFLLLSPSGDPEGHLATLAEIARHVSNPEVRSQLIAAKTPDATLRILGESPRG